MGGGGNRFDGGECGCAGMAGDGRGLHASDETRPQGL